MTDIAIVGVAFKMPQDAVDEAGFWDILQNRKNVMTEWPKERLNIDAFQNLDNVSSSDKLHCRGAHFLRQDPGAFDAPFFSVTAKEAAGMDPQHRLTLETSYRAFENAGIPLEKLRGSRMAVFASSSSDDYSRMVTMDPDMIPSTSATGTAATMLANRLSWYFDLLGPSVHVDTACSSSMTALDLGCQAILNGSASSALVAGANLILGPQASVSLSNLGVLSPDSVCYSFDHRANGYSRGEGVISLVLKPVTDAIASGDTIRAVIRSIGSNQDGKTPSLTQPSADSQEQLIRQVYQKARLSFEVTRYVEAHGTGTSVGDPIEIKAIGGVFRSSRSKKEPLYVGSVKANVGHLEGSSGLAGIVKAMLVLERGIIPPNALLERPNSGLDASFYNIEIPAEGMVWPTRGLRRVSVNSFGFGGSNTHVIMDDALHYLASRGLKGNHCTLDLAQESKTIINETKVNGHSHGTVNGTSNGQVAGSDHKAVNGTTSNVKVNGIGHITLNRNSNREVNESAHKEVNGTRNGHTSPTSSPASSPRLLVWSAAHEKSLERMIQKYEPYYQSRILSNPTRLDQMAYTLSDRRTRMLWRTFALAGTHDDSLTTLQDSTETKMLSTVKSVRSSNDTNIAFVFTGQGAQYVGMGLELLQYPVFNQTLQQADKIFSSLGATWSLFDQLNDKDKINKPQYSQPLTTALQIALVELLKSFKIIPTAVVGHSSGEIAAAYTASAVSLSSACKVAYYRGQLSSKLAATATTQGAMLSVNLPAEHVNDFLTRISTEPTESSPTNLVDTVTVACINSPTNVTLSGPEQDIDLIKEALDKDRIFAYKIQTGGVPYHSPAMKSIASEYRTLMGTLEPGDDSTSSSPVPMVSSLTGKLVTQPRLLTIPQYWVDNMVSPVKFSDALSVLVQRQLGVSVAKSITDLVEVGPHPALKRPAEDTLSHVFGASSSNTMLKKRTIRYLSTLKRSAAHLNTTLNLVGQLFAHGHPVSISTANNFWLPPAPTGKHSHSHSEPQPPQPSPIPIPFLTDCPEYPFDSSQTYWAEPRLSRDYRLRPKVPSDSLGERAYDFNPLEPRWRRMLSVENTPWTKDHSILGSVLYPGAGMLIMAMEAVKQIRQSETRKIAGFYVKEAGFINPIMVGETWEQSTEVSIRLRPVQKAYYEKESVWSDIGIFALYKDRWSECFHALVHTQYEEDGCGVVRDDDHLDGGMEKRLNEEKLLQQFKQANQACVKGLDSRDFYNSCQGGGMNYGESFQVLDDIRWDGDKTAVARMDVSKAMYHPMDSLTHPAVIDGALQALMPQFLKTETYGRWPVTIPSQLRDAWFSASGWQHPQTSSVRFMTLRLEQEDELSGKKNVEGSVHVFGGGGEGHQSKLICSIKKVILTPVSTSTTSSTSHDNSSSLTGTKLLYGIDWKPHLSLLTRDQLSRACKADCFDKEESSMIHYRRILDSTISKVVHKALYQLTQADPHHQRVPDSLKKYVQWMEHHVIHFPLQQQQPDTTTLPDDETTLSKLLSQIESLHPPWKLFPSIAENILPILLGETDPLQLAFDTRGLAEMLYADMFSTICDDHRFRSFLNLLSHENPTLRILEVGAGTGGMTGHVLGILSELERRGGGTRFVEYMYTDISPVFLENARERFKKFEERMAFRTFDVEGDPAAQGFDDVMAKSRGEGYYDVVFAGGVLHATADLGITLSNVHKLLKPGGRLVALEIMAPENVTTNFGFGVLPGWWLCKEEWRSLCPAITEEQWDGVLRENGFSGNDLVLRDWESEECHVSSIWVSTAKAAAVDAVIPNGDVVTIPGRRVVVLSRRAGDYAGIKDLVLQGLVARVTSECTSLFHVRDSDVSVAYLDQIKDIELGDDGILISLVEAAAPFLADLSETDFSALQSLIRRVYNLVWVTAVSVDNPECAHFGLSRGFLRTMRSENIDKRIISLEVQVESSRLLSSVDCCSEYIAKVLESAFVTMAPEVEYVARDKQLITPRIYQENVLNDKVQSQVTPQLRTEPWQPGPGVKLSVATPGFLDSVEFIEDPVWHQDLGPHEVEIEAKAWGLSFRDVFVALGRLDGTDLGYDMAGIVRRVGSACDPSLQPGDRVCGSSLGCMRTYPRTLATTVTKIPDSLSFEAAASFISPGITAYYSLIHVARLQRADKILIHSASGSTGQMATWIAKMVGAEIFATVGFQAKKQLLIDEFGIPADHIFYSRNSTFAQGIMRVTNGYGVDVVLNSLSGDGLRASWECMAAYGRFVEIGKADITSNAALPMGGFARNISFAAVDLYHVAQTNQDLACELLTDVMALISKGTIRHPSPLHVYSVTDVEQAFRYLQSGKNTGRIIISISETAMVPKRLVEPHTCKFDPSASYVVAGGLGGLGRAIVRWMVGRGARHLILPSRSGPASPAAKQVMADLQVKGVSIMAPQCDVSSAASLSSLLSTSTAFGMPPIKGCINAAMVIQDAVFDNMTHAQWSLTIKSKVQTSWNLHQLLPENLDFFILLSSLSGIYGSISQSNYAAGCNFQDALARYRVSQGQKAVSFDIGWMRNVGIVAENVAYQANRRVAADMGQIEDTELMALLDMYCDPDLPLLPVDRSQLLIGVVTPVDLLMRGETPPALGLRPMFAGFSQLVGGCKGGGDGDGKDGAKGNVVDFGVLFRQAAKFEERAEIVVQALAAKLARALCIAVDDVEPSRQLSDYGVDSLMAVELRNWITKDFAANVAVFDIMGGTKISAIGDLVVEKSTVAM